MKRILWTFTSTLLVSASCLAADSAVAILDAHCKSITAENKKFLDKVVFGEATRIFDAILSRATDEDLSDFASYERLTNELSSAEYKASQEVDLQKKLVQEKPANWATDLAASASRESEIRVNIEALKANVAKVDGLAKIIATARQNLPPGVHKRTAFTIGIESQTEIDRALNQYVSRKVVRMKFDANLNYDLIERLGQGMGGGELILDLRKPDSYTATLDTGCNGSCSANYDARDMGSNECYSTKYDADEVIALRAIPSALGKKK